MSHGAWSKTKSLGQHFLSDPTLLKKIASQALPFEGSDIVEIGPGPGGLTRAILELTDKTCNVYCVEKDKDFKEVHDELLINYNNLHFIYADALFIKPQNLTPKNIVIISNLPYNIGTRLLTNWLSDLKNIDKMILMFQKEVAQRICAKVDTKEYGRLSVISQLLCRVEKLFDVSPRAFRPAPKVDSSVVKLTPKETFPPQGIEGLEKLTSLCFNKRRKTIFSILKRRYENIEDVLNTLEIKKSSRPENITPEKFLELSLNIESF